MKATRLTLSGDLAASSALPWIAHRAKLLNLTGWARRDSATAISIVLHGPDPLIEAMAVACSLGPADVMVDSIQEAVHHIDNPPTVFEIM